MTNEEFEKLINEDKVLVDFYAEWCGPYKQLSRMLEENNIKHDSADVDSEEGEKLAVDYNIKSVTTILVFDNDNNLIDKKAGLPSSVDYLKEYN